MPYPTTIKLPPLHIFRVPPEIPLKRRARGPTCHPATYGAPRTDDDVNPAVHVGVLRLGVGLEVGGFGGPIGILPHDERFVQGVEAVPAQRGGVDGKGLLVAFGVCEVQSQGVGDPAFLLQGPDDSVDEVVGHGFVSVGQDDVHVSTAMPPISDALFKIRVCLQDSCEESTYSLNVSCYFIARIKLWIKSESA